MTRSAAGPGNADLRGLIGVIHLASMPGDPQRPAAGHSAFTSMLDAALRDADAWSEGGADALLVENFGSAPFVKGGPGDRLPPHQVAAMAIVVDRVAERFALPVGVNCLRNDAPAAIGIACAAGLAFARINVHTGVYVTDQGLIEGESAHTLRYREQLGAGSSSRGHVAILADVLVKHAAPLAPLDIEQATRDCVERGLADGIVVTGAATGRPIEASDLSRAAACAGAASVFIGSGVTPDNVTALADLADGAIVGSSCKRQGEVLAPVDSVRVKRLVDAAAGSWRRSAADGPS